MSIGQLGPDEAGHIVIIRPDEKFYESIPYDAEFKSSFNDYWTPELSVALGTCTTDDLFED